MSIPTKKKGEDKEEHFKLFPEGVYDDVFVTGAVDGKSKSSGRDMLTLDLLLEHEGKEKTIKYFVTYSKYDDQGNVLLDEDGDPVQTFGLKNFIEALVDSAVDGDAGAEPGDLIGRRCGAEIEWETEEYKGRKRTRERVKWLNRHAEGPIVPGGEGAAAAPSAATDEGGEDDLPF